jgi:hypothetical protein
MFDERLDVLDQRFQVSTVVGVDFLPLQRLHEAPATRIVIPVARPTHARQHPVLAGSG